MKYAAIILGLLFLATFSQAFTIYADGNLSDDDYFIQGPRFSGLSWFLNVTNYPADLTGSNLLIGRNATHWRSIAAFTSGGLGAMDAVTTTSDNWLDGGANQGTADLSFNQSKLDAHVYNRTESIALFLNDTGYCSDGQVFTWPACIANTSIGAGTIVLGDLAITAPITGAASDIFVGSDGTRATIGITVDKDIVTTAPLTGGENNVLTGSDADLTLAITVEKDLVTSSPLTGGTDDILTGSDSDVTLGITVAKDIVTGDGLGGGEDNVLTGADADLTLVLQLHPDKADGLGVTESASGLEFEDGNLSLLLGCGDNEILKWDEAADDWNCEADVGAAIPITFSDLAWIDSNGNTTSNSSVNAGDVAVSNRLHVNNTALLSMYEEVVDCYGFGTTTNVTAALESSSRTVAILGHTADCEYNTSGINITTAYKQVHCFGKPQINQYTSNASYTVELYASAPVIKDCYLNSMGGALYIGNRGGQATIINTLFGHDHRWPTELPVINVDNKFYHNFYTPRIVCGANDNETTAIEITTNNVEIFGGRVSGDCPICLDLDGNQHLISGLSCEGSGTTAVVLRDAVDSVLTGMRTEGYTHDLNVTGTSTGNWLHGRSFSGGAVHGVDNTTNLIYNAGSFVTHVAAETFRTNNANGQINFRTPDTKEAGPGPMMRLDTTSTGHSNFYIMSVDGGVGQLVKFNSTTNNGDFEIASDDGDIVLDPNDGNVDVDGDISMGGNDLISVANVISNTDKLDLETSDTQAAGPGPLARVDTSSTGAFIYVFAEDGTVGWISKDNATVNSGQFEIGSNGGDIVMDPSGNNVLPGSDNTDLLGATAGGNVRWADVKSVLINGADICFENDFCFTECINSDGDEDICLTKEKPTDDMRKTIGLSVFETYQEYKEAHSVINATGHSVFDNSMTFSEFNDRRSQIIFDGKLDALLGRQSYGSLSKIKTLFQRVNTIENALCNQGLTQFC